MSFFLTDLYSSIYSIIIDIKKKKITKRPPTRVHAFRCTDAVWKKLNELAEECGISLNRYLTETGLKHHPRKRLTQEETEALNSLTEARTDLIKIRSKLKKASPEDKPKFFKSVKFMKWWVEAVEALILHWYHIEQNITSPVLTKVNEEENDNAG